MATLTERMIGAARLDAKTFEEVEHDPNATGQAIIIVVLASVAAWALAKWIFQSPFSLPALELGTLTLVLLFLTLSVGLWNSAEILKRAPLAILREE